MQPTTDRSAETTSAGISWLQFHRARVAVRKRWPNLFKLPIDESPFGGLVRAGAMPASVLDVGATDRVWERPIGLQWPGVQYRSFDIDRTNKHDYHSFDDVQEKFEAVVCFEVLEHVPPTTALEIVRQCVSCLAPGGWMVITVPNVYTPGVQHEFTHQTAYALMDIGGLMNWSGLEVVDASRICLAGSRFRFVHQRLLGAFHRALKVDFCQSIAIVGRKPKA